MANLSKIKRDKMIAFLEQLKEQHADDESIRAFNEIENQLRDKKYGLVWEEHSEAVDEMLEENIPVFCADPERRLCKDPSLPWNFIIEGDNLQALYLLEKTHRGKVDCIYIDPPYNTGAHDWKYNNNYVDDTDNYKHSKWISMMSTRLHLAKELLNPQTGVLIVAIDDNELNTTGLLLRELFPTYEQFCITVVHNPNGNQGKNFGIANEFAYFMIPSGEQVLSLENRANDPDIRPLRDVSGNDNLRTDAKNCFYPIVVKDQSIVEFGRVCPDNYHPQGANISNADGSISIYPIDASGIEKKWVFARQTVEDIKDELRVEWNNSRKIYDIIRYKTHFTYKSVWNKKEYNANSYGSKLINKILGEKRFDYPKSLYTVAECVRAAVGNIKDAVVVDFFSGSGTTMHAVNLLNLEDGGNRTCIMVTNNEIGEDDEKRFAVENYGNEALVKWDKKPGEKNAHFEINYDSSEFIAFRDYYGIAKNVTWPRIVCAINGVTVNGDTLNDDYYSSSFTEIEKKRNITQIDYLQDISSLSLTQKRKIVSMLTQKKLPSTLVTADSKYILSEDKKHTISVLFEDGAVDEWLSQIELYEHITEFIIITKSKAIYRKAKNAIEEKLGTIREQIPLSFPMSSGFITNVKYYKCEWTPRKPEDYLLSNALCLHIREMIELQNAIEIDNVKNVLLLNKEDFQNIIMNPKIYEQIENVWVNQNMILNSDELAMLRAKGFKYIPREFFGQELREAAE